MEEAKYLSLRPLAPAVQRVAVYETKLWLYVVGSTNDGTSCRLLKLSRQPPTGPSFSLGVEEVGGEYTETEIKDTLTMLDVGNKNSSNKYRSHGLKQVASAFGIIGFIRFLEGYYIVLITKRKPVATIGGHVLYKIEDTLIYPIMQPGSKPYHPDESKYLKIFQNVDLSSNFYFSYSYDMTLPLQAQMRASPGSFPPPCRKFVWNDHMLDGFEGKVHPKWVLSIIYGFVRQNNIIVYGRSIYLTMIARRSKEFAGTRFLKRGANDEGHVANEVEIEQIVLDAMSSLHANGRYTSFLQLRGSVPSFWSQDLAGMRPKPQITIDRATPFASPAGLHFVACLRRYGSPVICLNLVKKRERKKRESLLTNELQSSITYLNQFLPPEHHIGYVHKDMARINKSKAMNLIVILEGIAEETLRETGFFHSGPELECNKINPHPDYKKLSGGYGYREGFVGKDQTGVLRVNCVDCLDRTNTAQFIAGKCALGYQLSALGVLTEPTVPFDCDTIRVLEEAYEDLGDTLAIQYGGSQLVHRIQTYRKVAPVANHGRDLYQTIHRYYRNAFTDADKQMAINVFLGMYQPGPGEPDIWDLSTDYYLHHTMARLLPSSRASFNHTKWWDSQLIKALPRPLYRAEGDPDNLSAAGVDGDPSQPSVWSDSFDEVYKPFELTDFDSLFSKNIPRTSEMSDGTSPFVVREKQKKKLPRKAWRPAIVGSPNPPPGGEDDSGSSSSDLEEDGDIESVSLSKDPAYALHPSSLSPHPELLTTMQAYGFQIEEPSAKDRRLYERYVMIHEAACEPCVAQQDRKLSSADASSELDLWKPMDNYGTDDWFSITPPQVSQEDREIYRKACEVAEKGPANFVPTESLQIYSKYIKQWCDDE